MAALLAGQSISQVAEQYQLPKGTVGSWKLRQTNAVASAGAINATDATQKHQAIGDKLHDLVLKNLTGLIAVAELLTDRAWLKQQDASSLATLAGVTCDKTVRILEAMAGAQPAAAEIPAPPIASTAPATSA